MGKIVLSILILGLFGCASGHCRGRESIAEAAKMKWTDEEVMKKRKAERVFVYKPDGSLQCGMGQPLTAEAMSKQLGDIKVLSMENKHDGLMRTQVCGSATGQINIYEISAVDLEAALKADFKEYRNR
jgi:hypothetical protein